MNKVINSVNYFLKKTDIIFWLLTISATLYGFILIYSMSRAGSGSGRGFLATQAIGAFLGISAAIFISLIDYQNISKFWYVFAIAGILFIIYTLIFGWGPEGVDDKAWVSFGPINFQPSELVKIFFIITFSKHLSVLKQNNSLETFFGVIQIVIHAAIPIILVHIQGDDGTALVFMFMFLFMAFGMGVQLRYFLISIVLVITSIPLLWKYFFNEDQKLRFLAVLDLDSSVLGKGWQQYQGKISIASGEFSGRGLFQGPRVTSGIVPYQESDFIFTVAGEELGFIGCIVLILILFILSLRALKISMISKDFLGKCMCFGFFGMIFSQAAINIAMCLGIIPVIGITLPFFSSGGSSIICLYLGIGLIQSVYAHKFNENKVEVDLSRIHV